MTERNRLQQLPRRSARPLQQLIHADKWFTQELERLRKEGWVIVGDYAYRELDRYRENYRKVLPSHDG